MKFKILRRSFSIIVLLSVQILFAHMYEEEPHLLNSNLRLAAMGNLYLVVEEFDNEINAYDFGELSAGLIDDNKGKSMVYASGIHSIDVLNKQLNENTWNGNRLCLSSIIKFDSAVAISGSFSRPTTKSEGYSPIYMWPYHYYNENIYDTVMMVLKITHSVTLGLHGGYFKNMLKREYSDHRWTRNNKIYFGGPSFWLQLVRSKWGCGFSYQFTRVNYDFDVKNSFHLFSIPAIYNAAHLNLGIKASYQLMKLSDDFTTYKGNSLGLRGLYRLPIKDSYINIGVILNRDAKYYYEYYGFSHYDWKFDIGIGVAFTNNNVGLFGIQYQRDMYSWDEISTYQQNFVNVGTELCFIKNIPIRIGYAYKDRDPANSYYSYQHCISSGFGINIPELKTEINFAYNFVIMQPFHDLTDYEHTFGLSWRIIF